MSRSRFAGRGSKRLINWCPGYSPQRQQGRPCWHCGLFAFGYKTSVNRHQIQAWVLRLVGLTEMLAFGAVVMPRTWMVETNGRLGLAELPDTPLVNSILRQVSFTYRLHGLALWVIAWDVVRYRPLVIFTGIGYLLAGPTLIAIDFIWGMPMWWVIGDGGGCLLIGVMILWLEYGGSTSKRFINKGGNL
jgi:hypothetical protein